MLVGQSLLFNEVRCHCVHGYSIPDCRLLLEDLLWCFGSFPVRWPGLFHVWQLTQLLVIASQVWIRFVKVKSNSDIEGKGWKEDYVSH